MLKITFNLLFTVCLFWFTIFFQECDALTFKFTNQSEFNAMITTLKNYANKQYITELYLDGYVPSTTNYNNISGISVLSECTALEKLTFRIARSNNLPSNSFDQYINAIKNLKNVYHLYTYFYVVKQSNPTNMNIILNNFKNLTYFYWVIATNGVSQICPALQHANERTKLTYFYVHFGSNSISDISCFQNMFVNLTELNFLGIIFSHNQITSLNVFQSAFDTLTKVETLQFYGISNAIPSYSMQNTFLPLVNLKSLTFELGPEISTNYRWSNFTISHPNIETIRYYVRPYLLNSNELFSHLPKLKRVDLTFRYDFRQNCMDHVMSQLGVIKDLYYFYIYFYAIPNDSNNDLNVGNWGSRFASAKEKITHFEFYEHWNPKPLALNSFSSQLGESYLPNLEWVHIYRNRPHTSHNFVAPALNHSKIKTFYYRIHDYNAIKGKWSAHKNLFANLPNLKYPMVYIGYCQLTNADMSGYSQMFSHLAGREFESFYLHLYYNLFTSYSNLQNTQGSFSVTKDYFNFYIYLNQIKHFNGLQNVIESFVKPETASKMLIHASDQEMNDISKLGESLQNYVALKELNLQLYSNDITDLTQLQGVYDNKPQMEKIFLYVRNNPIMDQSVLDNVFLPVTYYGRPNLKQFGCDLKHPDITASTISYSGMEVDGQYPAILKYGYCLSDYQMAKRFVMGSNLCLDCVNANCHSCSKPTHCDVCRLSDPLRELPLCMCPIGYYGAAQHTCLLCSKKCKSCDNGQNCLTCVNSTPKRIVPDCICPVGYYDDGIQDQCQECKLGCFNCKDGMSCISCIDGYYQKGSQCLKCPQHFSKCNINSETQVIEATQCYGQNRFYILPDCPCVDGYYPIPNFSDCVPCNMKCTQCTSAKVCQACAVKYYHDSSNDSCNRCKPLCKTCSNGDYCDSCEDRQFDPATSCSQKYTSGGTSSSGGQQGGQNDTGNNNNGNNGGSDGSTNGNTNGNNDDNNSDNDNNDNSNNDDGSNNADNDNGNNNNEGNSNGDNNDNGGNGNSGNGDESGDSNQDDVQTTSQVQLDAVGGFIESDGLTDPEYQESSKASFSIVNPTTNITTVKSCQRQCLSCEDSSNKCLECYPGLNKQNNPPLCSCKFGYHSKNNSSDDCYKCDSQCQTCLDQQICTSCRDSDNRILNVTTLSCDCQLGYKSSKGSLVCSKCFYYKDECLSQCPQNTILDQKTQTCAEISYSKLESSHRLIYVLSGILILVVGPLTKIALSKLKILNSQNYSQVVYDEKGNKIQKRNGSSENSSSGDDNNEIKKNQNSDISQLENL